MSHFQNNHPLQQHNIHGGNQRNKQFHHNERQEQQQPQPFFKNNQYYQFQNHNSKFYQNQNNYQHNFHNQNHQKSQNGISPLGERDEYAGLMNAREKHWLNNIQLLQLNTNQPYIDDFYYTVFCDRLNRKNEMKNKNQNCRQANGKGNNNNNNGYRDSR